MRPPGHRHEAGFTLVELLVALALLGLLTVLVFGGLRLSLRAWTKTHDEVAEATDLWAVESLLNRTIASADPAFASPDANDRVLAFDGEDQALALLAPLPQAIAPGLIARMRFFLLPDGESQSLFMAWRLDLPAAESGKSLSEDRVKLLDRVETIHFDYFGPPEGGGPASWRPQWSGRSRLPELVRIRLERDDPRLPAWPELLARPTAGLTTSCLYDPVTGDCRRIQ
jgi:general secretion pathway protein J